MPTPDDLRAFAARYADTVASRDADAYASLFAPDAVQRDPASSPPNVGRDAVRAFFAATVGASAGTTFEIRELHTCGDAVALAFTVTVLGEDGGLRIEGVEVFELDADGLIGRATAWWDGTDVVPVAN